MALAKMKSLSVNKLVGSIRRNRSPDDEITEPQGDGPEAVASRSVVRASVIILQRSCFRFRHGFLPCVVKIWRICTDTSPNRRNFATRAGQTARQAHSYY